MSLVKEILKIDDGKHQESEVEFAMGDQVIDQAYFEEQYENRIDYHRETKDKLALLRSCITLLNNLEGTIHNQFAGRVLLFLAKAIPLFDQSGLNKNLDNFSIKELPRNVEENLKRISDKNAKKSNHTSNGTILDLEEGETLSDDDSNDSGKTIPKNDTDLSYESFWTIQRLLYKPNELYKNMKSFRTNVDKIINIFKTAPANMQKKMRNSYMTEPRAFALQLGDVNMRRAFLVQLLIVLQYLEQSTESRSSVLDKDQPGWPARARERIISLLYAMPISDKAEEEEEAERKRRRREEGDFLELVRQILIRENLWIRWKNEKCPEPKKIEKQDEVINMRGTYHKKRKISDEMKSAKPYNMHVIGSHDMSRLWNMKPNKEFSQPELSKYIDIPEETQAEKFKDPNYSFRVLRLLRKNAHFFEQTSATIQSLDLYLKTTTGRILQQNRN